MEKKANAAFEKQRQEALAKAQRSGKAKNFQLSEEGSANAALKRQLSQPKHHDLPSEQRAAPSGAQPVAYHPAPEKKAEEAASGLELNRYMEQQAQRDREFRERQETAEREKQAALAGFGSSLSKYEEQARQRDLEAKQKREEEERRRDEENKATAAKLTQYREKQAAEEADFRRRHEEAERAKQDSLNAMRAADDQRRQAALARDAELKKTAVPTSPPPKANGCATCQKELPAGALVNVKGKNYCYGCSIAAQADQCFACNKPILSAMMKANNRKYHPECLKCSRCKNQLTEGFRMRGKDMMCVPCSSKP